MTIERQVIVTWYTPEEKLPPEGDIVVVTASGKSVYVTYDHCFALAEYYADEGWIFSGGINDDAKEATVHAWCDLETYGGAK